MPRTWFEFKNADGDNPELFIYDEIGMWGVDASEIRDKLAAIPRDRIICLRVNSPGGDVFQALAIYNMLVDRLVTVQIDGIAASAASLIAMAGDPVVMPENAMMMIHNPSGMVWGDSDDMRSTAEALDKIKEALIATYARKSGMDRDELWDLMTAETWLTASEAVDMGFANEVKPAARVAAVFDIGRLPTNVKGVFDMPDGKPKPEKTANVVNVADVQNIIQACNKAGFPALAARAISSNVAVADLAGLVEEAKAIKAACELSLIPTMADSAIADGKTLEQIKAALFDEITADDSAFRQQETVQSKAGFLEGLISQDDAKPTQAAIPPDAGYTAKDASAQRQPGPTNGIQTAWDQVWN